MLRICPCPHSRSFCQPMGFFLAQSRPGSAGAKCFWKCRRASSASSESSSGFPTSLRTCSCTPSTISNSRRFSATSSAAMTSIRVSAVRRASGQKLVAISGSSSAQYVAAEWLPGPSSKQWTESVARVGSRRPRYGYCSTSCRLKSPPVLSPRHSVVAMPPPGSARVSTAGRSASATFTSSLLASTSWHRRMA